VRYLSVCSGIEAATVAWQHLGWKPVAFAEIEKFPAKVLAHHYPDVPNHGDFTTITGDEYGAVDLLIGGTPCQDFSVAGLRAGMDGQRGQLTVEFAHLAHRLAAAAGARWLVWENVPGVLSIDDGGAFAEFLGILAGRAIRCPDGGWRNGGIVPGADGHFGLCWRVLDAQHFGVPQRRRRVFVVGYLGDWRRAAAVLLEQHSLSGHPAPRRETRQSVTHDVAESLTSSGRGVERPGSSRGQDPVVRLLRAQFMGGQS
jgi:DNA (cytosine-5)-methyltransferase 1